MPLHTFPTEIAEEYGIVPAILLNALHFWISKNIENEKHYHDGNYWTYSSVKAFSRHFRYLSSKQITNGLNKLIDNGIVLTGNYNQNPYDRTLWYAITEKGYSLLQKCIFDLPKWENGKILLGKCTLSQKGEPIPDIVTDNIYNPLDNSLVIDKSIPSSLSVPLKGEPPKTKKFIKPKEEEIQAYCDERHNAVDASRFFDYYQSKGWVVGKAPMKDWKAAVRTWEKNSGQSCTSTEESNEPYVETRPSAEDIARQDQIDKERKKAEELREKQEEEERKYQQYLSDKAKRELSKALEKYRK